MEQTCVNHTRSKTVKSGNYGPTNSALEWWNDKDIDLQNERFADNKQEEEVYFYHQQQRWFVCQENKQVKSMEGNLLFVLTNISIIVFMFNLIWKIITYLSF